MKKWKWIMQILLLITDFWICYKFGYIALILAGLGESFSGLYGLLEGEECCGGVHKDRSERRSESESEE